MIVNGSALILARPIKDMLIEKRREHGVSYGLSEAGYDIRVKQDIVFHPYGAVIIDGEKHDDGHFTLASTVEEFHMPQNLVGIVHDKSTWARQGLSVFNTVIEPGWCGFLTLELVHHGNELLHIPAGAGIAQVIFHQAACRASYDGKYQNQSDRPVEAIFEKG